MHEQEEMQQRDWLRSTQQQRGEGAPAKLEPAQNGGSVAATAADVSAPAPAPESGSGQAAGLAETKELPAKAKPTPRMAAADAKPSPRMAMRYIGVNREQQVRVGTCACVYASVMGMCMCGAPVFVCLCTSCSVRHVSSSWCARNGPAEQVRGRAHCIIHVPMQKQMGGQAPAGLPLRKPQCPTNIPWSEAATFDLGPRLHAL